MKITIYTSESGTRSKNVEHSDAKSNIATGGYYSAESSALLAFIESEEVPATLTDSDGDEWKLVESGVGVEGNEDFFIYEA
jgi:hypothetical protein